MCRLINNLFLCIIVTRAMYQDHHTLKKLKEKHINGTVQIRDSSPRGPGRRLYDSLNRPPAQLDAARGFRIGP